MKWKKFSIHTTTEAEDLVSMMLTENGVEGVEIDDNVPLTDADTKGMFIDILPDMAPDTGKAVVSFYLHLKEEDSEEANNKKSQNETAKEVNNKKPQNEATEEVNNKKPQNKIAETSEDRSYEIADRLWTDEEIEELVSNIKEELSEMSAYTDIGEGRIEIGETEDTDWRDNWKQFFKPILLDSFLIKPTWENVPEELKEDIENKKIKVIEIDPGTAFGTGSHETTQLCMKQIIKYVCGGEKVLDIGTGSGILGIAALKEGADFVCGTELDEMCEPSIKDNLSFNNITEEEFKLVIGNVIGDEETIEKITVRDGYDVVIANILAPVIIMLAGKGCADRFIKQGGMFITSGIIDTKEDEVVKAFENNKAWEIVEINHLGEWVNITAVRV